MNVKLYGLQRSCTNYAAWLLDTNFREARTWHDGGAWKHSPMPVTLSRMDGYALCHKNPYAWVDSFIRYQEAKGLVVAPLPAFIDRWNTASAAYLEFAEMTPFAVTIRHESLLMDLDGELDRIGARLDIEREPRMVEMPCEMWRGGDNMRHAITGAAFDPAYYTSGQYLKRYTPDDLEAFSSGLDAATMRRLNYEVL